MDSILTEEKSTSGWISSTHSTGRDEGRRSTGDARLRAGGGGRKGPGREARVAHAVGGEGEEKEKERLRSRGSGGGWGWRARRSRGVRVRRRGRWAAHEEQMPGVTHARGRAKLPPRANSRSSCYLLLPLLLLTSAKLNDNVKFQKLSFYKFLL